LGQVFVLAQIDRVAFFVGLENADELLRETLGKAFGQLFDLETDFGLRVHELLEFFDGELRGEKFRDVVF